MSVVANAVRKGTYLDSVALMRLAQRIKGLSGVEEAGLMIGTPANRDVLADAGILTAEGRAAGPGDMILAVRAVDQMSADAALDEARRLLDETRKVATAGDSTGWQPRTIRTAAQALPDANLALISVPGDFAAAEAMKALDLGLNVMIFSDNVPVEDEIALKRAGAARGQLVMGPDCGTAIIGGVPLGFANAVPRGDIGIIGASGTGIQEVSCLLARAGCGVSHAIGTGGRDLKSEVGGLTTLMAIDLLEADPETRHIVLISKPPAEDVARKVLDRISRAAKPFTVCFLGSDRDRYRLPRNVSFAPTLEEAAQLGFARAEAAIDAPRQRAVRSGANRSRIVGLFSGGTLAAEAQVILRQGRGVIRSNAPIPGVENLAVQSMREGHVLLDLGDDEFTRGRPHPMIEPAVRDAPLREALADPSVGVVLIDVVLGTASHPDPAGHLASVLRDRAQDGPAIIASVTGTNGDAQGLDRQTRTLQAAGVTVAPSNAAAARLALSVLDPTN